jgi:hypothetical protein
MRSEIAVERISVCLQPTVGNCLPDVTAAGG